MAEQQDLTKRVEELEKKLDKISRKFDYGNLPTAFRFDKDVLVSPGNKFRLEPLDSITTALASTTTANKSVQGDMIGGALQAGTNNQTLVSNVIAQSMSNTGIYVPVSNSNTPFVVTLSGNTNNQSIAMTSGVQANYVMLDNTTGASVDLTGLVATDAGHEVVLLNKSSFNVVIKFANINSSVQNRFYTLSGADVTLTAHQSIRLRYRTDVLIANYMTETRTGWQETK